MNDFVIVDKAKYRGTPGLYELIFKRIPVIYIKDVKQMYKSILLKTNVHMNYDAIIKTLRIGIMKM